ncbi:response regulator transcription factor [Carboxylicivirga sp. A043]|uniref:response regulator transcription factor n=1 Tax=Carboxylicivirga litoralis TaxID=2816963 RepID=UPI0021CAEF37|nr:response regulator transcription factor [Carboxylicivirga sp. A043]MCU4157853.1 response regulator transcription factor [Carboxylicivirga sp. A043]
MIQIAIVEDHQMVREGIKVLINQTDDMEVAAEFNNAGDWLSSLSTQKYDVSLIDIDMPGINGLTALNEGLILDNDLRAIMLTMHRDVNFFREAFVKGAKGYVLKDMSVNELCEAIREVNKGNTFFSDEFLKSLASTLKDEQETLELESSSGVFLNESEQQLLTLICRGYTNKELAESMYLSVKTIESHKTKLLRKTGTRNNAGLIVWAIKNNKVDI